MVSESVKYELLVQTLLQDKLKKQFPNVKVLHNCKYRGITSGHDHQIDLSFELDVAGTKVLFLAECKKYKRKVGIDELLEFSGRIRDIGAHKGIVITTEGFEKGALKVARAHRIALVVANGLTYVLRNRMNVPSDILTDIVRENELACYLAAVYAIPPEFTLTLIDQNPIDKDTQKGLFKRFLGKSDNIFGQQHRPSGIFSDLDEVYGLCNYDEWVRFMRGVSLPGSEFGLERDLKAPEYVPLNRVKKVVNNMYGPGVINNFFPFQSIEGLAFELHSEACNPVLTPFGFLSALSLLASIFQYQSKSSEKAEVLCYLSDDIFSNRFKWFAAKYGWQA